VKQKGSYKPSPSIADTDDHKDGNNGGKLHRKEFLYIIDGHFSILDIPFFMQHGSYHCVIKRLSLDAIVNNQFHTFATHFSKIYVNVVFLSTCRSPKCSLPF
jgi:hypothetical protein